MSKRSGEVSFKLETCLSPDGVAAGAKRRGEFVSNLKELPPLRDCVRLSHNRKGFTLVEMLVAFIIFSIISITVYSVFRSGLKTWTASSEWLEENQKARNFFSFVSRDLKNMVNYSKDMPFEGKEGEMTFMTIADSRAAVGDEPPGRLVKVSYGYDPDKKVALRRVAGQAEGFDGKLAKETELADEIEKFKLEYAYKPVYEAEKYRWKSDWKSKKNLPRGVRIQLNDLQTTVFIPSGVLGNEEDDDEKEE